MGYLTPREIELEPLFKFLQGSLPSYMVPSAIVTLDKLPPKNERKVDRRALLQMTASQKSREAGETDAKREGATVKENCGSTEEETGIKAESYGPNEEETGTESKHPESGEVAERLVSIFGQVLGLESYPVDADFFRSGCQSLLFRLLQMINSELDMTLSLTDILQSFQNLSPLSLASSIVGSAAEGMLLLKNSTWAGLDSRPNTCPNMLASRSATSSATSSRLPGFVLLSVTLASVVASLSNDFVLKVVQPSFAAHCNLYFSSESYRWSTVNSTWH